MGGHINIVVIDNTLMTTDKVFAQSQRYSKDKPACIATRLSMASRIINSIHTFKLGLTSQYPRVQAIK